MKNKASNLELKPKKELEEVKHRATNLNLSDQKNNGEESIEDKANIFSRCFLMYLNPLFRIGSVRLLEQEDLGVTSQKDRCGVLSNAFDKAWAEQVKKPLKSRSLWNALVKTVGFWRLIWAVCLYAIYAASSFIPVIIMNALINYFQGTIHIDVRLLWIYVALLFIIPMIGSVASAQVI